MKQYKNEIPADIGEYLNYDPYTGVVMWVKKPSPHVRVTLNEPITYKNPEGYYRIQFRKKLYLVHRIIWFLMTGEQPDSIDHVNNITYDNRWVNLRHATRTENARNRRKPKNNTSGYKGVHQHLDGGWVAEASCKGKSKYLGKFSTPEDAYEAYCAAINDRHKEFKNYG